MKSLKKGLRLIGLGLLILLALSGIGITGAYMNTRKEQDYDHEIKTELVEGTMEDMEEKSDKT